MTSVIYIQPLSRARAVAALLPVYPLATDSIYFLNDGPWPRAQRARVAGSSTFFHCRSVGILAPRSWTCFSKTVPGFSYQSVTVRNYTFETRLFKTLWFWVFFFEFNDNVAREHPSVRSRKNQHDKVKMQSDFRKRFFITNFEWIERQSCSKKKRFIRIFFLFILGHTFSISLQRFFFLNK